jgi:cytochrome c peroxidase
MIIRSFVLIFLFFLQSSAYAVEKREIDSIFKAKCMDCHSNETHLPWYAELPIAKQLITADINKGRSYFLFSRDFFQYENHEDIPKHVIKRLQHEIAHDYMPPYIYRFAHLDKIISQEEKQKILAFLNQQEESLLEPLPLKSELKLDSKKVALGKKLYHDTRLSHDNSLSCASCHDLAKGGTDQAISSTGINGQIGPINSPTTYNSVYNIRQFWDGRAQDLEEQAHGPVNNPGEMGSDWKEVIAKLKKDSELMQEFKEVYDTKKITGDMIANAIAEFEKSLITANSRFDAYLRGDKTVLSQSELKGYKLFEKHNCSSCHFGKAIGGRTFRKMGIAHDYFNDRKQGLNGLKAKAITEVDAGLFNQTHKEADIGVFKVPILRNIELSFPYLHDGSLNTLEQTVEVMAYYQNGTKIKKQERDLIVAFLKTLTDEDLK